MLLGRLVDLGTFKVVRTLTDAPDEEVADDLAGIGIVRARDGSLQAFRLSDGNAAWSREPFAPCRALLLTRSKVYAGCGDKLVSYTTTSGEAKVVDNGPHATDPVMAGSVVVSPHDDGRINVYDLTSDALRASKALPELTRALHQHVVANPSGNGVCVLGLVALSETRWQYNAGCYDDQLGRRWTKTFSVKLPAEALYDVRQLGPRHLVLDDQSSPWDSKAPPGPGHGVLLRWRDGSVNHFDDATFATLEDSHGDRLRADVDVFAQTQNLTVEHERFVHRQAKVVGDAKRAFALVVNGSTALGGVDRETGHTLFLVPTPLGSVWTLELADGMPIVRTQLVDRWVATLYDPANGSVLYQDTRPRAPAR